MSKTLSGLIDDLTEDLKERRGELVQEPDMMDNVHEIIDGWVPIYYVDIEDVFKSDLRVSQVEACMVAEEDGKIDLHKAIQVAIYQALEEETAEMLQEWEKQQEEDEANEVTVLIYDMSDETGESAVKTVAHYYKAHGAEVDKAKSEAEPWAYFRDFLADMGQFAAIDGKQVGPDPYDDDRIVEAPAEYFDI